VILIVMLTQRPMPLGFVRNPRKVSKYERSLMLLRCQVRCQAYLHVAARQEVNFNSILNLRAGGTKGHLDTSDFDAGPEAHATGLEYAVNTCGKQWKFRES